MLSHFHQTVILAGCIGPGTTESVVPWMPGHDPGSQPVSLDVSPQSVQVAFFLHQDAPKPPHPQRTRSTVLAVMVQGVSATYLSYVGGQIAHGDRLGGKMKMTGHDRPVIDVDPEVTLEAHKQIAQEHFVSIRLDDPQAIDPPVQHVEDTRPQSISRNTPHVEYSTMPCT